MTVEDAREDPKAREVERRALRRPQVRADRRDAAVLDTYVERADEAAGLIEHVRLAEHECRRVHVFTLGRRRRPAAIA